MYKVKMCKYKALLESKNEISCILRFQDFLSDLPGEHGLYQIWVQILPSPLAVRSTMDSCLTYFSCPEHEDYITYKH